MRAFAHLLDRLSLTAVAQRQADPGARLSCKHTPDPDRGWALAALTGELSFHAAKPASIRKAVEARMDPLLFGWSYDYVGDLAETVALVWPAKPGANREPELSEVVEALRTAARSEVQAPDRGLAGRARPRRPLGAAQAGDRRAARGPLRAPGQAGGGGPRRPSRSPRSRSCGTRCTRPTTTSSPGWRGTASGRPPDAPGRFRPVMLAQAIDEAGDFAKLDPADYAAEWKWDGIRVQAVNEGGERRLYTRTGDDISHAFPDVVEALGLRGRDRRRAAGHARRQGRVLRRPAAAAEPQDRRRQADGRLPRRHPRLRPPARGRGRPARPALRRAPQAAGGLRGRRAVRRASTCRPSSRSRPGRSSPPCAPIRRRATRRSPRA